MVRVFLRKGISVPDNYYKKFEIFTPKGLLVAQRVPKGESLAYQLIEGSDPGVPWGSIDETGVYRHYGENIPADKGGDLWFKLCTVGEALAAANGFPPVTGWTPPVYTSSPIPPEGVQIINKNLTAKLEPLLEPSAIKALGNRLNSTLCDARITVGNNTKRIIWPVHYLSQAYVVKPGEALEPSDELIQEWADLLNTIGDSGWIATLAPLSYISLMVPDGKPPHFALYAFVHMVGFNTPEEFNQRLVTDLSRGEGAVGTPVSPKGWKWSRSLRLG